MTSLVLNNLAVGYGDTALVQLVGAEMWLASRRAIDRGMAEGSPERAAEVLEGSDAS